MTTHGLSTAQRRPKGSVLKAVYPPTPPPPRKRIKTIMLIIGREKDKLDVNAGRVDPRGPRFNASCNLARGESKIYELSKSDQVALARDSGEIKQM